MTLRYLDGMRLGVAPVVAAIALTGCAGGGSVTSSSGRAERVALDDIPRLTGCTGYGHSGIEGYGVQPSQAFLTRVCVGLVGKVLNLGIGGSTLQGQLLQVLQEVPRDADTQLSIVMWGANDLALFGPDLSGYKAGLRMLISRLRTPYDDIHTFRDRALSYSGRWANTPGEKVTDADAAFTWTSPRGFRGGPVAFIVSFRQGIGARYSFSLDGRPAGIWDTAALGPPPPAPAVNTPAAYRIEVPPGGGHTVRCRLSEVRGAANLAGWELEATHPPLVVLVEHPRPPSYAIYDAAGWRFHPTDAQILSLDRAMRSIAAEFGSYVITVDPDPAVGKRRAFYLGDETHFNVVGNARVAQLIEQAIERDSHVRRPSGY